MVLLEQGGPPDRLSETLIMRDRTGGRKHFPTCVVDLASPDKQLRRWAGAFGTLGPHSTAVNCQENLHNLSSLSGLSFLFWQMGLAVPVCHSILGSF